MKKKGDGYWIYKGCDIYLAEHPKLSGKYEIYKGCDFIQRAYTLKEAHKIIINNICNKENIWRNCLNRMENHENC